MATPQTTNKLTLDDWRDVKLIDIPKTQDDSSVKGSKKQRQINMRAELEYAMSLCEIDGLNLEKRKSSSLSFPMEPV